MPRSKEAIAVLRGFCKHESKQKRDGVETGDALFAKGILACLRWMTEEDSPCPYSELEEDMPDDGGWEASSQVATATRPQYKDYQDELAKHVESTKPVNIPQFESQIIIPGEEPPDPNAGKKLVVPGRFSQALEEQPWLKEYVKDISQLQVEQGRMTVPNDSNAVIVGAGLEDGPRLAGGGGEY